MRRLVPLVAWAVLAVGLVAAAATAQPREALGGVVGDLRLASTTLPTGLGWTPPVAATGALVPGRGIGAEGGVFVFAGPGRFRRLSFGATGFVAEGRATGVDAPTMATRMFAAAPHAALNFGHRDGWSYLSIGAGAAKVRATEAGVEDQPASWGLAFHYGGGARWFVREHLAVSLDLRFWALTPRPATTARPSAAATTRIAIGVGVSFR
ncbi:MAG: hypothetical protein JNL48_01830 [Acidobacteria bacterium]|nr:hypothetical protein [Acidobacteriota bacterium]